MFGQNLQVRIGYSTIETKKWPVLDIMGFFFCMSTQVKVEVRSMSTQVNDQVNDINLVPKMGQIIKAQRPVSSAPISGLYHRPLLAACIIGLYHRLLLMACK